MGQLSTLSGILKGVVEGQPWYGDPLSKTLDDVTAKDAAAKPVPNAHSIWEIALHMEAWQQFTLRSLQGESIEMLTGADDWPPVNDTSESEWTALVNRIKHTAAAIRERIEGMEEDDLRKPVGRQPYPFKVLLHGIAHHNIYHQGQIGILKKALGK